MKNLNPLKTTLALTASLLALSSMAWSNPLGVGSTTLSFTDGSTVTGFFAVTAGTNQISSWDLQLTPSADGVFGSETYSSTDANGSSFVGSDANGNQILSFFDVFGADVNELQIVVACGGVQNCLTQASAGTSFALVTGPCNVGFVCGNSGEFFQVPDGFGQRLLDPGFLNVTDPPATLAFNIATTATGTVFGSGGGGNNNGGGSVPEPGTWAMFVLGLAALAGLKLRRRLAVRAF
jgi:hypothetical protein